MKAVVKSTFHVPADTVRTAVRQPETLTYIAHPLITFRPISDADFPETWQEGAFAVSLRLFGLIPLGQQIINVESGDDATYFVRDNGRGESGLIALITRWDHQVYIQPKGERLTAYTDSIDIEAGIFTLPVVAFARVFYTWRQRRLLRLLC